MLVGRERAMIDTMTLKPLKVTDIGTAGPFVRLAYSQLPELRQLLDKHQIRYSVAENIISFNGGPEAVFVNFGRGAVADAIQAILDDVS
jgi:hypothetical protein